MQQRATASFQYFSTIAGTSLEIPFVGQAARSLDCDPWARAIARNTARKAPTQKGSRKFFLLVRDIADYRPTQRERAWIIPRPPSLSLKVYPRVEGQVDEFRIRCWAILGRRVRFEMDRENEGGPRSDTGGVPLPSGKATIIKGMRRQSCILPGSSKFLVLGS